jgi:hypothetical protein
LDTAGSVLNNSSASASYRADDVPQQINWSFNQDLDQLNVTWFSPIGDFTIGRQPIAFGQAKLYSPIDVIQPAGLLTTDRSYRAGVDAVRGTWMLGAVSEVEAGYVFGLDTVAFARLKAYLLSSDWELVGIDINQDQQIVSLGVNSGIGSFGLWQETAILKDDDADVRVTAGVDTIVLDDLYLFAEIHYNGLGEASAYELNSTKSFYQLGAVLPPAQWYASLQGSYPINIVTQVSGGITANLNDGSILLSSAASYNASDELSVLFTGAYPMASEQSAEYEFSLYPASVSVQLNWVF